jgi:hypothetical protein
MSGELGSREKGGKRVTCEAAPGSGVTSGPEGSGSITYYGMHVSVTEVRLGNCHAPKRLESIHRE